MDKQPQAARWTVIYDPQPVHVTRAVQHSYEDAVACAERMMRLGYRRVGILAPRGTTSER